VPDAAFEELQVPPRFQLLDPGLNLFGLKIISYTHPAASVSYQRDSVNEIPTRVSRVDLRKKPVGLRCHGNQGKF
jgi:hypothetical protein